MQPLVTAIGLVAAFLLFLKAMERRMIFYPTRQLNWLPSQSGLAFQDLRLRCADGVTIHGWFIPAPAPSRATVLFFHGNAGNISHRLDKIFILRDLQLDVCIVDYHGYGQSEGKPSEKTTYLDADAAYQWLTRDKGINPRQILVWGESLGGGVATYLAAKQPVGGLVLESTFTSLPDVARTIYPFLPTRWLMANRYDSLSRIRQVQVPVLSLHSPQDEIIPYRLGRQLFDAAPGPKQFVDLVGDHNGGFLLSGDRYREGIQRFLDDHFPLPAS